MMIKRNWIASVAAGLLAFGSVAYAQAPQVPQVQTIGPTDLFQDVVGGQPSAQSFYAPATLLGNYPATQPGNNAENWLIGGDATTNLFQQATSGSSVTTALTYGGPDRWAYWSGTATAMTVSQDTTAADLRPGYKAAFKMARTSGQTGVVQMCMMQPLESVNSYAFQGGTAEVDFDAVTGANFSPASGNITVYYITGTGTDQGASTAAFNLNAGGGGSSLWTGQVNTGVVVSLGGAGTTGRYGAVFPTTTTTTQVAVALCMTPVGTAGTNDYVAFGNIQLTRNSALASLAGTSGAALINDPRLKSFSRRSQEVETGLQQRYTYSINERNSAGAVQSPLGSAQGTTTTCTMYIPFPVVMRAAPTYTNALSATTFTMVSDSQTATVLGTPFSATLGANSVNGASINITTTGMTAKDACFLTSTASGGGKMLWTAEL